jgi:hypothetical protein
VTIFMGKLRIRFSLKELVLLFAFVSMAIAIVVQVRELVPLRAEVRQMRTELGKLSIDDATRVQAIEVRQPDPNMWRWRVHLPPGGKYKLLEFDGILPPRGTLSNQQWLDALKKAQYVGSGEFSSFELEGELTLEATLTPVDGKWKFETHPGGGESGYVFTDNWPADTGRTERSDVWEDTQRIYKPGEPILLLWLPKPVKTPAPGGGVKLDAPTEPAEGIALWLEQQPPGSSSAVVAP